MAGTFARLADAGGHQVAVELGSPSGARWLAMDDVEGGLDVLFADASAGAASESRHYLGATVASALSGAVVSAGWPALLVDRRLPDLSLPNLLAHRHPEGWFDRIALRQRDTWLLARDPLAAHQAAIPVAGLASLHRRFTDQLAGSLAPWFAAIRGRAPFGRTGMWGQVADDLCGTALWTARRTGGDERAAWDEAQQVVALLARRAPELKARPRLFPVRWSGGESLFQVKGTCCLWYKTQEAADPDGEGYCGTCPLRGDCSRRARLVAWLEKDAAAAG